MVVTALSSLRPQDGGAEPARRPFPLVKFREVHTTFVRGEVNRAYFGLGPREAMPVSVLLTEKGKDSFFSSLALHTWVGDPSKRVGVYKIFSRSVAPFPPPGFLLRVVPVPPARRRLARQGTNKARQGDGRRASLVTMLVLLFLNELLPFVGSPSRCSCQPVPRTLRRCPAQPLR